MYVKRRYGFWMTFSYNYIDFRTLVTIIIPYICYKNYEVIVVDEVHNLISQITNGRGPSIVFYDWIVESVNTKIVFLSGTPIINSPTEIAYLFNMLKGKLHVYDFFWFFLNR